MVFTLKMKNIILLLGKKVTLDIDDKRIMINMVVA